MYSLSIFFSPFFMTGLSFFTHSGSSNYFFNLSATFVCSSETKRSATR